MNYINNNDSIEIYHSRVSDNIDIFSADCTVSSSDAEKLVNIIELRGLEDNNKNGYVIFDTCAVTESAHKKCKSLAQKIYKKYYNRQLIFTGCGVSYEKEFYNSLGMTINNQEKAKFFACNEHLGKDIILLNKQKDFGIVKIEDGCYNNCAYCIVHKIRPHYQVPYEDIKNNIKALINNGKKNIILAGTEITSYCYMDLNLVLLCKKILNDFPEIEHLKIDPIDPAPSIVVPLIEFIKQEKRMDKEIILCTQSCCDTILKNMRRRHTVKRLHELNELSDNIIKFIYQIIVGFPGETDELFNETLNNIKELKPVDIDLMVFSPRIGTDAYSMHGQIDGYTILKRKNILQDLYR